MDEEQLSELGGVYGVMGRDEEGLFSETVHNYEYGGKTVGSWEMFYEVHGDQVPWFIQYRQLFELPIQFVVQYFGACTVFTRADVRLNHSSQTRPVEILPNEFNGFCLSEVTCHRVVMVVVDDLEVEVLVVGNVQSTFEPKPVSLMAPAAWRFLRVKFLIH